MKHDNHDNSIAMQKLKEVCRHIAHGIWSLPVWNNRSEAEVITMAERVLEQQFKGVLTDWRDNVIGPNYDEIHRHVNRLSIRLLIYIIATLRQANPLPLNASKEADQFWRACCELEARRWRMEMIHAWYQMFSVQRLEVIQTPGNYRYKLLGDGVAVDLSSSKTVRFASSEAGE